MSLLLPQNLDLREIVAALDGSKVSAISIDPVTLEDAYFELIGDSSFEEHSETNGAKKV
jgi:hypothetical protein